MLEHKLKERIMFLASTDKKKAKDHILAMDVLRRASRLTLEMNGLVCGDWIDVAKLASIHRVWAKSNLEIALKTAALQDESWTKEDSEHAIHLLHSEEVEEALRLICKDINGDIAIQSFKLTLADPEFNDIYVSKVRYWIPRESWVDGFVETWTKELAKQGVQMEENKEYLKNLLVQILGGLGE